MRTLLVGCFLLFPAWLRGGNLQEELKTFADRFKAQVGIAVIIDHVDTIVVNDCADYPLMSVFKFHQALAVADRLCRDGRSLDYRIWVRKKDLRPDTWSPLRDRYPDGNVSLTVRELLSYTMQLSDNNACDILFRHFGGPRTTQRYIRRLGFRKFRIRHDEAAMHRRLSRCYGNRTSPLDAAGLVEYVRSREWRGKETYAYIYRLMETCETGLDRIPAPLRTTGAVVGHKTGTGDCNSQGKIIAVNDVGYVELPDGHGYSIAVFVKDSEETPETSAAIIAGISELVWKHVSRLPALPD